MSCTHPPYCVNPPRPISHSPEAVWWTVDNGLGIRLGHLTTDHMSACGRLACVMTSLVEWLVGESLTDLIPSVLSFPPSFPPLPSLLSSPPPFLQSPLLLSSDPVPSLPPYLTGEQPQSLAQTVSYGGFLIHSQYRITCQPIIHVCVCVCVCIYVCMYYVCMYVCMYSIMSNVPATPDSCIII